MDENKFAQIKEYQDLGLTYQQTAKLHTPKVEQTVQQQPNELSELLAGLERIEKKIEEVLINARKRRWGI